MLKLSSSQSFSFWCTRDRLAETPTHVSVPPVNVFYNGLLSFQGNSATCPLPYWLLNADRSIVNAWSVKTGVGVSGRS